MITIPRFSVERSVIINSKTNPKKGVAFCVLHKYTELIEGEIRIEPYFFDDLCGKFYIKSDWTEYIYMYNDVLQLEPVQRKIDDTSKCYADVYKQIINDINL